MSYTLVGRDVHPLHMYAAVIAVNSYRITVLNITTTLINKGLIIIYNDY